MPKLKTVKINETSNPGYLIFNNQEEKQKVFKQFDGFQEEVQMIHATDRYSNVLPNISVRDGFNKLDYDWFRPEESAPQQIKDVISACMKAHYKFSLVRNVIELMADFASKGVRLAHKNKKQEKAYKYWFKMVNGPERSERFLNYLYRCGNVVANRRKAKIKGGMKINADDTVPAQTKVYRNEIPYEYRFYNPVTVDAVGGDHAIFANKYLYSIKVPVQIKAKIKNPKNQADKDLINSLPSELVEKVKQNIDTIDLDPDTTRVFFYKKDDWQVWAYPLTSSILGDLITLEKMKLADLTALDCATSKTRVWKLGDLEKGIMPGPGMIAAFKSILMNRVPGDTLDLVWNPAIDLIETKADLSAFLGEEKYRPILSAIYSGLGVPSTLVAGSGDKGFTNNFISMKTLIERLQYGRDSLIEFWQEEIRIFQKAMGYDEPAQILFDNMNLSDESSEKALWVQLFDRNVVSIESLQERFGLLPEIEKYRVQRERKEMDKGIIPNKISPYQGDKDIDYTKILLTNGEITAGEAGVELEERKPGEKSRFEQTQELAKKTAAAQAKAKGDPNAGRPTNSKDSKQRKKRQPKPRTTFKASAEFVDDMFWAKSAYGEILQNLQDVYLFMNNTGEIKKEDQPKLEQMAFSTLCNFNKGDKVSEESVKKVVMAGHDSKIADELFLAYMKDEDRGNFNDYVSFIYSLYKQSINEVENGDN